MKEIRNYIKGHLYAVDRDFKEYPQVFPSDIPSTIIGHSFVIVFGDLPIQRQDTSLEASVPVVIEIYTKLNNNVIENFDNGYSRAISVACGILNQESIAQDTYIKAVNNLTITPSNIDNNSGVAKFTIEALFSIVFN
jgi:hypothetical protein